MQTYGKQTETMQNNAPKQTLGGVVAEKIVGHVRNHKAGELLKQFMELILGLFLGACIVAPAQIMEALAWGLKTHDFAIPKVCAIMVVFFGRKTIMRQVRTWVRIFQVKRQSWNKEKLIDGIPVSELANYLVRNHHFKREGVNGVRETFGLNMEKFNRLAGKLEENGVLVRGENNGRVLDGKWSLQALVDYLSGTEKSKELKPLMTIHRIGSNAKVRLMRPDMVGV